MTYICYEAKNFRANALETIENANRIITTMAQDGYRLSLRQLYYQFVSEDLIPNTERSYKNLGTLVSNARLAGLISWMAIEDRGRVCANMGYWEEDTYNVIDGLEGQISFDRWARQENYVEVWVEKDALSSVIARPCHSWNVRYMACKGYMSSSAAWVAGQRYKEAAAAGKNLVLIHLGDHDPSGIDMTRDNNFRVDMFAGTSVEVRRLALNMDQIEEYGPPPNPAKLSDSRAEDYVQQYGSSSWELDALKPAVIDDLIRKEIRSLVDYETWVEVGNEEEEERQKLRDLSENWDQVSLFLEEISE